MRIRLLLRPLSSDGRMDTRTEQGSLYSTILMNFGFDERQI